MVSDPSVCCIGQMEPPPLPEIEVRDLNHLGLLSQLWDDLGLSSVVDQCIPVDDQVQLRPSVALKALCLNVVHGRDALYRVQPFFSQVPTELLLGEGVTPDLLNDDALGRHLDRLFEAGGSQLFNALSLRVIAGEGLELDRLHADTTSKLVFGEYASPHEEAISVTYGHSKDHRPDLKQVMAGVTTTTDGVPTLAEMLDGNQSDKTWHGGSLERLRQRLKIPEERRVHYVGDSALITQANLDTAARCGIEVTGRLPRTVGACAQLVTEAVLRDEWEELGAIVEGKKAARYEGQRFTSTILGQPMQGAVYRSSEPQARAEKSVRRRQQRSLKEARAEAKRLMKESYSCEADADQAHRQFQARWNDELLGVEGVVERRRVEGRYERRGRPALGVGRPVTEEIGLRIEVVADEARAEQAILDESCFVLVHLGRERLSARELLEAYKGQSVVETRFPFLKDAKWADLFFVKRTERVEALGYVLLISLLLWTVWERRVRRGLVASGEAPLRDVTGMEKSRPTAMVCTHILRGLRVARTTTEDRAGPWQLIGKLNHEQARVVRFTLGHIN